MYVDADAPPGGDGHDWPSAFNDLQDALERAREINSDPFPDNDIYQIWIAEGVYTPTAERDPGDPRSASFSLPDDVTLYGGFAGDESTLDARDWSTHVTTLSGDLGVPNDTSDNAYAVVYGGGIIKAGVDGVTITGGNANGPSSHVHFQSGGGVYLHGCADASLT